MGKAMAHMAVVFAELERDFIRMRTREGCRSRTRTA
jgi:DNA invertase Pin-like site-specific DNA recombinase